MNDFETKVLQVVNRVLGPNDTAEFYSGSLFVECSESMAQLVHSEMLSAFRCKIHMAKCGPEWGFDFA